MDNNQLDIIAKLIRDGADDEEISQYLKKGSSNLNTAINAGNTFEKSLGRQYLKQTGVSIPDYKNASTDQLEKFSRELLAEQNPSLKKTGVKVVDELKDYGNYLPSKDLATISKMNNKDIEEFTGTLLHEGGHGYDFKKGLYAPKNSVAIDSFDPSKKSMLKASGFKRGSDLAKEEASVINEIIQAGHHANIPKVREGTFGRANLLNIMKGKAVRAVPFIGPALAAGATMLATGDASAATQAATPILNEADSLGPEADSLEATVENPSKSYEQRKKAIEQLSQRRD